MAVIVAVEVDCDRGGLTRRGMEVDADADVDDDARVRGAIV